MAIVDIFFRWLHVTSAILAIGGAVFLRLILPAGLKLIDESKREEVLLACRRKFKILVHASATFLVISGVYNTIGNWPKYALNKPLMHGLWGPHLLFGLAAIVISFWLLAGKTLRKGHRGWMLLNIVLLLVTVLLASSLKWARDHEVASRMAPAVTTTQPVVTP